MRKGNFWSLFFLGLMSLFLQTKAFALFDKVVVFGDSLSDNGNIYSWSSKAHVVLPFIPVIPKNPPYFEGRFSNGPIWIEHVAKAFDAELVDYAYGGAWAESMWESKQLIPFDLATQVNFYLVNNVFDFHKDKHLYVIWMGSNDYAKVRDNPEYATDNTVRIIKEQVDNLVYYGAKNVLIVNIPDIGLTPQVVEQGPDAAAKISKTVSMHNFKLSKAVKALQHDNPKVKFALLDITDSFNRMIYHPEEFGLKNSRQPCYDGGYSFARASLINNKEIEAAKEANMDILNNASLQTAYLTSAAVAQGLKSCPNPDEYAFWDKLHPTRIVHHAISLLALDYLTDLGMNGSKKVA